MSFPLMSIPRVIWKITNSKYGHILMNSYLECRMSMFLAEDELSFIYRIKWVPNFLWVLFFKNHTDKDTEISARNHRTCIHIFTSTHYFLISKLMFLICEEKNFYCVILQVTIVPTTVSESRKWNSSSFMEHFIWMSFFFYFEEYKTK